MNHTEQIKRWNEWRKLKEKGISFAEIGRLYGVAYQVVQIRIKKGKPKKRTIREDFAGVEKWRMYGRERNRFLVRKRDNFTCKTCGKVWNKYERMFDVHHIDGLCGKKSKKYDRIEEMEKLITLCHKCHFHRHDLSKDGYDSMFR